MITDKTRIDYLEHLLARNSYLALMSNGNYLIYVESKINFRDAVDCKIKEDKTFVGYPKQLEIKFDAFI